MLPPTSCPPKCGTQVATLVGLPFLKKKESLGRILSPLGTPQALLPSLCCSTFQSQRGDPSSWRFPLPVLGSRPQPRTARRTWKDPWDPFSCSLVPREKRLQGRSGLSTPSLEPGNEYLKCGNGLTVGQGLVRLETAGPVSIPAVSNYAKALLDRSHSPFSSFWEAPSTCRKNS